jgi:hypothetical protein
VVLSEIRVKVEGRSEVRILKIAEQTLAMGAKMALPADGELDVFGSCRLSVVAWWSGAASGKAARPSRSTRALESEHARRVKVPHWRSFPPVN